MDFASVFQVALEKQNKFSALRQTVIDLRLQGIDKDILLSALEEFRQHTTSEKEDIVLEVMDCLVGYCIPQMIIE